MLSRDLETWVIVSLVTAIYILARHWRNGTGVGLLIAYVLSFGALHWLVPALYLLPWYWTPRHALSIEGLRQSTYGLLAFAAGGEISAWFLKSRNVGDRAAADSPPALVDAGIVNLCLLLGVIMYAVVMTVGQHIPSVTAIASTGSTLTIAGLALKCWNAWQSGRPGRMWLWLLASCLLPVVTIVTQGFLGYGFAAMLTVFAFVASFYPSRWKPLALGLALVYLGLSVFLTYMRDRTDIRDVMWTNAGLNERVDQLFATLANFEWFDPQNESHLTRMDSRLNQDYLIGAAVMRLRDQAVPFARGETLVEALMGFVPRAVWPDKPTAAGSGNLVSTYTGIRFAEGTSVGIGQVMECYVNFGTPGVVAGFVLFGCLVVLVDGRAAFALRKGDVSGFTLWFLPGLSLLQVGGSLVEVTTTGAAAAVVALLLRYVTRHFRPSEPVQAVSGQPSAAPPELEVRP